MLWRSPQKNCYDVSAFGYALENCYEAGVAGEYASDLKFTQESGLHLLNAEYCKLSLGGQNHFGCVSVRKGEYVIFNKIYSKEDYYDLRERIIIQMNEIPYVSKQGALYKYGEFFPLELSPFPYNITYAQLFYPKLKEEIEKEGLVYLVEEKSSHDITCTSKDLPDKLDSTDGILKEIIECSNCLRGYKVISMELNFLRKMDLPLPRICPFCRVNEKLNIWVENMKLHDRTCDKCGIDFKTHYTKERAPHVLCKKCYQQEFN